jgi:hypothetical protein
MGVFMRTQSWRIDGHVIELQHKHWAGTAQLTVDGATVFTRQAPIYSRGAGFARRFSIDGLPFAIRVARVFGGYRYDLLTGDQAAQMEESERLLWEPSHGELLLMVIAGLLVVLANAYFSR